MTPEERELRRALEARSENPSPGFRARLSASLAEDKPASNLMPLAAVAAVVLVFATVGVLLLARQSRSLPPPTAATSPSASATPMPTPPSVPGVLTRPPAPISLPASAQLTTPSANVVWALVVDQYLYRSTDRGATWEQRPVPALPASDRYLSREISFMSDQEGWFSASGYPGLTCDSFATAVWHTTDAGATWQLLPSKGIGDSQCKNGLSFVDSNRGFVDAWDPNHAPVTYRTSDGGRTWAGSQPLPDPPGFKTQAGSALQPGLVQAFGSTLLVPAWNPSGGGVQYVFHSTDGGATWIYLASAPKQGGNVDFVTASRWLKLIGPGQSTETTDAGVSWHSYPSDYSQAAPVAADFVFGDSQVGYATVRGGISRTVDGGLHWTAIETPGTGLKVGG
jgi:photosystem II stability/assembly factor-like uncharacterized protein